MEKTEKQNQLAPHCPVAKKCSGCQLQNMSYEQQLKYKQIKIQKNIGRYGKVKPVIGMENPYHYRNKVTAIFKTDRRKNIVSGIYQSATHGIVQNDDCLIEDILSDKIIKTIRLLAKQMKIPIYDARNEKGFLKYVLVRRGFSTDQVMVILVCSTLIFPQKNIFVSEMIRRYPQIRTIVLNVNDHPTKMFLGEKQKVIFGNGYIEDVLCGFRFMISPKSFYQINPVQTEVLYNKALELAKLNGNETVLDAYCGIGTIGMVASQKVKQVIGVESNQEAIKDAIANAKLNKISNIYFHLDDAGDFMQSLSQDEEKIDVLFMDPPRAGSDKKFLFSVLKLKPEKIIYISCNVETQSRDLYMLCNNGYKVTEIQGVDMFPHTNHVETVVLMSRVKN